MVVYATTIDEISPLVKCGVATGFNVTPRSGGHQYAPASFPDNKLQAFQLPVMELC